MPTTYIGLYTTTPTSPTNAGTEMTGGSYARTLINASWAAAASGSGATNAAVQIICTTGTVTGWGIFDASSAGNMIEYENLMQSVSAESQTFDTAGAGVEVLKTTNIGAGGIKNVIVKDATDVTTYVENTDYWVQYDSGRIVRNATGSITSGQNVHVTYDYLTTRTVAVDADIIQFNSGNLISALKGYK